MMEDENQKLANPCTGAIVFGLNGALMVTIGAAIRENNINTEALTVLVGGALTGAIAGSLGCFVPHKDSDVNIWLRISLGVLNAALCAAPFLTGPLLGEECLGLGSNWGQMLIDELIGAGVIFGGAVVLGLAGTACKKLGEQRFFSSISSKLKHSIALQQLPRDSEEANNLTTSIMI
jgi:hypothetical protein